MKRFFKLAVILACVWALGVAGALLLRHQFIYPFAAFRAQPVGLVGMTAKPITRADGSELTVWMRRPTAGRPVIFFFMGNTGSLAYFAPKLAEFGHQGYGIAAMTYRGGGGADGTPNEANLGADALLLWDNAAALFGPLPSAQRVIYGQSLGTGVASGLAAKRAPAALILETPFTSMCEAIQTLYPILPACLVMWDELYPTIERIPRIAVPLLVLHGDADRVISVDMGKAVHAAHIGPKELKIYPGGRHNDLRLYGAGLDAMAFIDAVISGK